ncbi:alcohol dehydrogenase [Monoraphidium neglectum]|uniref:Alcohol dehydrogenase n=1 Tax=Monoraphidium neglectum TaxID=145388 RepID=A0A0D2NU03_9CHLO|nr:alcohol dehydrogenase [Monoraphidium neglectum]KIZ07601.1 alcohol dehydrogenase [Monoraphidium neglectum]|eukprot:XP_013906620.1 alcohol dehydrogenase [Monoraphidium neglectum]
MEYLAVEIKEFSETAPVNGTKLAKRVTRDPGAGEVQVKMTLAAVNPSDVFSLQGIYPRMGRDLPAVPGFDGVGVVTKVGPGVEGFAPGQRVTARPWRADKGDGSWQQYTTIPANLLVPVPDAVSDEVAAQFYINPVTVVGLLEETAVPKGGYLIVTAAGSTLSKMLLSMAKSQGIKTIAVVRRQEQAQEILAAGADHVVCSTTEDLVARVKEITGGVGADAAADSVAGPLAEQLGNSLKTGGLVLIYGIMDGASFTGSAIGVLFNGIVYKGFWMEPWLSGLGPEGQAAVMTKTMDALAAGAMTPDVGKVYPLERYQEAVEESAKTARGGKVLIKLN